MCAVEARAGRSKRVYPLVLPKLHLLSVTPDEFRRLQESCHSLKCLRTKATTREVEKARDGATYHLIHEDDLLYRKCLTSDRPQKLLNLSLVAPSECRPSRNPTCCSRRSIGWTFLPSEDPDKDFARLLLARYVYRQQGLLLFLRQVSAYVS